MKTKMIDNIWVILFLGRLGFLGRRRKDKILNYLIIYIFVNVIA